MATAPRPEWVICRSYAFEYEAHIAAAILDGAGIAALVRGNDTVGLFGTGFQGASARGVLLLVPRPALTAAQVVLAQPRPVADHEPATAGDPFSDALDDTPPPATDDGLRHAPIGRRRDDRRDPA